MLTQRALVKFKVTKLKDVKVRERDIGKNKLDGVKGRCKSGQYVLYVHVELSVKK